MIVDCVSDLHGFEPKLPGGDLLILAGDHTTNDSVKDWVKFFAWLKRQAYQKIAFIGGNHDNYLAQSVSDAFAYDVLDLYTDERCVYLCDSGCEFEGYKIWGSPWQLKFRGQNHEAMAFSVDMEVQLQEYFDMIPDDTDILITHTPPYGILDTTEVGYKKHRVGSTSLLKRVKEVKPKVHIFGHIHGCGGKRHETDDTVFVNAAVMNDNYIPVNKYQRLEL